MNPVKTAVIGAGVQGQQGSSRDNEFVLCGHCDSSEMTDFYSFDSRKFRFNAKGVFCSIAQSVDACQLKKD